MESLLGNLLAAKKEEIRKLLLYKKQFENKSNRENDEYKEEVLVLKRLIIRNDCMKEVIQVKINEFKDFIEKSAEDRESCEDSGLNQRANTEGDLKRLEKLRNKLRVEANEKKMLEREVDSLLDTRERLKEHIKLLIEKKDFFDKTQSENYEWIQSRHKRRVSGPSPRYQTYLNPNYYITQPTKPTK